jgi:hypothetical protein
VSLHPKKLQKTKVQCHPAAIRSHSATRKRQECFMPTSGSINDEDRPSELWSSGGGGDIRSTCFNIQKLSILSTERACVWMSFGWLSRKRLISFITYTSWEDGKIVLIITYNIHRVITQNTFKIMFMRATCRLFCMFPLSIFYQDPHEFSYDYAVVAIPSLCSQ